MSISRVSISDRFRISRTSGFETRPAARARESCCLSHYVHDAISMSHIRSSNRTVKRDAALLIVGLADLLQNLARLLLELLAHVLALVVHVQIEGAVGETEKADNDTDDAETEGERGGLMNGGAMRTKNIGKRRGRMKNVQTCL